MKLWTVLVAALAMSFGATAFGEDAGKDDQPAKKESSETTGKEPEAEQDAAVKADDASEKKADDAAVKTEDASEKKGETAEGEGAEKDEFPTYEAEVTGSRVSIRSGPNAGYARIMRAAKGLRVIVVGEEQDWARILIPAGRLVWVHNNYVTVDAETNEGVVTADKVNIRINPEPEADVVGQLSKQMRVEVTGGEGDWIEIKPPSAASAFISKEYLKHIEPEK